MGRPPTIPAEKKTRIVLSVLAGEVSIAEAARREKISEQSIGRWKADFLEAGRTALVAGKSGPSTREQQLEAEVAELTQALGEAAVEIRVRRKVRGGSAGPFEDLEVIRVQAGMSTTRFCQLAASLRRQRVTSRRHQLATSPDVGLRNSRINPSC